MSKTLHVNQIREGLAQIERLGHKEETFTLLDKEIRLRTVHRKEMEAATTKCQPLLDLAQKREDTFAVTNWIQAVKIETLSYSIMRIDGVDFEGVDFIATDEIDTETGHAVKKQKHVFVRELIENWEDSVVNIAFKKYKELTDQAEKAASNNVEFDDENEKARIEELEAEISSLKIKLKEKEVENKVQKTLKEEDFVSRDTLKDTILNPESKLDKATARGEKPRSPNNDTYVYREDLSKHQEEEVSYTYDKSTQSTPKYVNEEGIPLEGQALEAAKAQDRLQAQRETAKGQNKERQPLNDVNAKVQGHAQPKNSPQIINKRQHEDIIPVAQQGPEVLSPQGRSKPRKGESPRYNEKPDPNINPNFRPPHQRNKK